MSFFCTFCCRCGRDFAGFARTRAQTYTVLHDTERATRWHLGRFFRTSSASHICSPMITAILVALPLHACA